ncbi:MAG TPA: Fic family protein [Pseudonocardiaceae bacterium]
MIVYLDSADLLMIASSVVEGDLVVRDAGLLDAAAYRPQATMLGAEAYPTLWLKAAALLDSIVRTRPLVEGNWRLAWVAVVTFCDLNGWWVDAEDEAALDVIRRISRGDVELAEIAHWLETWAKRT